MSDINLDAILDGIKPNLVTPQLSDVTSASTSKKPRVISHLIVQGLVETMTTPITKEVMHQNKIHQIRYLDITPLLTGPWAMISLMILPLSYGEQSTIIEAIYPEKTQLSAKAFAVTFAPGMVPSTVQIESDPKLLEQVESANAGIAMILAKLGNGTTIPHADEIKKERNSMAQLVQTMHEREQYKQASTRAQEAAKHQDGLSK